MLRRLGLTALALLLTLGAYSIGEAAQTDDAQNNYFCRGGCCYNQNYNQDAERCEDYCGGQRGCW